MQCRKFRQEKIQLRKCDVASCKKMQLRKCNVGSCIFFCIFCCICFGAVVFCFPFLCFFFRKKQYKSWSKLKKKNMQGRKCNVASCKICNSENATLEVAFFLHFSIALFLAFAFSVAFFDFPDLLQLALWFCLEFSRQRMLLIEGSTATSLGARRHIAQELPGSLYVSLSFVQFQS